MSSKQDTPSTHRGSHDALCAARAGDDDKFSRHPEASTVLPWADRIDIAPAHACANRLVEARPGKRDRTADEGCVAGLFGVRVVECRGDAVLLNRLALRLGTQAGQCLLLPELKEQRTHVARDLGLHNRKHRRPSAAGTLSPHGEGQAATWPENPAHFTHRPQWIWQVHESEGAERYIEARIRQGQVLGVHAFEGDV